MGFEWPPGKETASNEQYIIEALTKTDPNETDPSRRGSILDRVRKAYKEAHEASLAASKNSMFKENPLVKEALRLRELRDVVKFLSTKPSSNEDWSIPTKRHRYDEQNLKTKKLGDYVWGQNPMHEDRKRSMKRADYEKLIKEIDERAVFSNDLANGPDNAFLDRYPELAKRLPYTQKREARLKEIERREQEQKNAAKKPVKKSERPRVEATVEPKSEKKKVIDRRGRTPAPVEEAQPAPESKQETVPPPMPEASAPEPAAPVAGEAAPQPETRPAPFIRQVEGPLNREQARKALLEVASKYINADSGLENDTTAEIALLNAVDVVLKAYERQPSADFEADHYNLRGNVERWQAQRRVVIRKRTEEQKPEPVPVEKTQAQKDQEQLEKDKREDALWREARRTERELRQGGYIDPEGKLTVKDQNGQSWKKALALILGLGVLYAETEVYSQTVHGEPAVATAQRAYDAAMGRAPSSSAEERLPSDYEGPRTIGTGDEQSTERGREGYRSEFEPDPEAPIAPTRFEPASAPDRNVERDS